LQDLKASFEGLFWSFICVNLGKKNQLIFHKSQVHIGLWKSGSQVQAIFLIWL